MAWVLGRTTEGGKRRGGSERQDPFKDKPTLEILVPRALC
jgi:hypothetical protein